MTCQQCKNPYTFNMNCRQCVIKHLRMIPKWQARSWLKAYQEKHGEAEMMKLIDEVKSE
jgi:hypothetical protein